MMGPFITAIGAIVSTTYFDPFASLIIEKTDNKEEAIHIIMIGRIYSALILLTFSIVIIYYV
jgi:hypothetical protein